MADAAGLTKDNIGSVVAAQARPSTPEVPAAGTATASLRWFSFTDTSNYFIRIFKSTAEWNTPDANGKRYFIEERDQAVNNVEIPWVRSQVYWTGSDWFACPTDFANETTIVAATGQTASLYCKSVRSQSKNSNRDISGLKVRDIVREIRAYPLTDAAYGSFANWGPAPDQIPQDATWPTGSVLSYRTVNELGGAQYYSSTSKATIPPANDPSSLVNWRNATLAEFVAWNAGDFASGVSASQVHGNNSRVLVTRRDYKKPDGSAAYKRYLVGFESGGQQRARFYECEGDTSVQAPNGKTATGTCQALLTTTYSIAKQGDAKVLSFEAEPTQLNTSSAQTYRLFIERNGVTYNGFKDKPMTNYQLRLNETAAVKLLTSVGLD